MFYRKWIPTLITILESPAVLINQSLSVALKWDCKTHIFNEVLSDSDEANK